MNDKIRKYLILRLDEFTADSDAKYEYKYFSIEHILPQTVPSGSEWERTWTEEDIEFWKHKIGNLIPLNRKTNSKVQNKDFKEKKETYLKNTNGAVSYILQRMY